MIVSGLKQERRFSFSDVVKQERTNINHALEPLEQTVKEAALRMRKLLPEYSDPIIDRIIQFSYPNSGGDRLYATDRPDLIFAPHTQELHTVTSTLALRSINDGVGLIAPELHYMYDVGTHKGAGLNMFSIVMESFGFTLLKDSSVWLGTKVDAESIEIDRRLSKKVKLINSRLEEILFYKANKYGNHEELNPLFKELFSNIKKGLHPTPSAELEQFADEFLAIFADLGTRDGWYVDLYMLVKGFSPAHEEMWDPDTLENILPIHYDHLTVKNDEEFYPMVVTVDKKKLFETNLPYTFTITMRDPSVIVPARRALPLVMTKFWVEDLSQVPSKYINDFNFGTFAEMDEGVWLTDEQEKVIKPADLTKIDLDPTKAICKNRYKNNPTETWRKAIRSGLVAPVYLQIMDGRQIVQPELTSSKIWSSLIRENTKQITDRLAQQFNISKETAFQLSLFNSTCILEGVIDNSR